MGPAERREMENAVLASNAAFYDAFTRGDFSSMRRVWASSAPITCCHPGAPVLAGRDEVLASFRQILRTPSGFVLRCDRPSVQLYGDGAMALVTGYEGSDEHPAHLAATNVFVREDGAYKMVHHQAGPMSSPVPRTPPRGGAPRGGDDPSMLN